MNYLTRKEYETLELDALGEHDPFIRQQRQDTFDNRYPLDTHMAAAELRRRGVEITYDDLKILPSRYSDDFGSVERRGARGDLRWTKDDIDRALKHFVKRKKFTQESTAVIYFGVPLFEYRIACRKAERDFNIPLESAKEYLSFVVIPDGRGNKKIEFRNLFAGLIKDEKEKI